MKINQIKELIKQVVREENDYQQLFKTMLNKSGKSIPSMNDTEKKVFFNAVDKAYKAKTEGKLRGYNENLPGNQEKLDTDKDGEIEASDLAALRAGKKADESVNEANKSGDKLTHKHNPNIEIELIEPTNKGWKVYQIEKGKKKIAYFDKQDISGDRALFESVNEAKFDRNFAKKIESIIKKELGVGKLKVTGPHSSRFAGKETYFFSIDNPTHMIEVSKQDFGGMYEDFYDVILTNNRGHSNGYKDADFKRISDESNVLKTVSTIAKKYKKQLTYAGMKESVNEGVKKKK
jgi:hypothetical protein